MTLTNRIDKLILLARTDRSVLGIQLLTLLSYDPSTEKGRISIYKNAFALIRLKKYIYALSCFLYCKPPMLKEACSVACKQMNDPCLALLLARLVEERDRGIEGGRGQSEGHNTNTNTNTTTTNSNTNNSGKAATNTSAKNTNTTTDTTNKKGGDGGLVLGACSRNILLNHIIPPILQKIKEDSESDSDSSTSTTGGKFTLFTTSQTATYGTGSNSSSSIQSGSGGTTTKTHHLPSYLDNYSGSLLDLSMVGILCSMWLQDIALFRRIFSMILEYNLVSTLPVSYSSTTTPDTTHANTSNTTLKTSKTTSNTTYFTDLNTPNTTLPNIYKTTEQQIQHTNQIIYHYNTINCILTWLRSLDSNILPSSLFKQFLSQVQVVYEAHGLWNESLELYKIYTSRQNYDLYRSNNEFKRYCMRVYEDYRKAAIKRKDDDNKAHLAEAKALVEGEVKPVQEVKMSAFNLAFSAPKPVAAPAVKSMLDEFDVPPPATRSKPAPAVRSMLDEFDVPPPAARSKPAPAVRSMLDEFDVPPPATRSKPNRTTDDSTM